MAEILSFGPFRGMVPGADYAPRATYVPTADTSLYSKCKVDPDRIPGVLSPIPERVSLTNGAVLDENVIKMIPYISGSNAKLYGIAKTKVFQLVPTTDTITNAGNFPHQISAGTTLNDIIVYANNGAFEVFYSWNDGTDGDVGRLSSVDSSNTFDDDYFTAVIGGAALNKNFDHPLALGDNNILYIADGSNVKYMDLRTGTPAFDDSVIDLRTGWEIKRHLAFRGLHWFAARETHTTTGSATSFLKGRVGVHVWDYTPDGTLSDIFYVEDSDVNAFFIYEGNLWMITSSASSTSNLRRFNGSTFEVMAQFAPMSTTPIGGVAEHNGRIIWAFKAVDGTMYAFKDGILKDIGTYGQALTSITPKPDAQNVFYLGVDDPTDGPSVMEFDFDATSGFEVGSTTFISGNIRFPHRARIREFHVYFPQFGNNGAGTTSLSLDAYFNGSDNATNIGTIADDRLDENFVRIKYREEDVFSLTVGYSYTGVDPTGNTILPYKIDVVWEPTEKGRSVKP